MGSLFSTSQGVSTTPESHGTTGRTDSRRCTWLDWMPSKCKPDASQTFKYKCFSTGFLLAFINIVHLPRLYTQICALELPWNGTGSSKLHRRQRSGAFFGYGQPDRSAGHPAPWTVHLCWMGNGENRGHNIHIPKVLCWIEILKSGDCGEHLSTVNSTPPY